MPIPVTLYCHRYKYFAYERELAERELRAFGATEIVSRRDHFNASFPDNFEINRLRELTYFSSFAVTGLGQTGTTTLQHQLELSYHNDVGAKRQQTRYSVHCWHEYKGRFNPQIVHGILNCFFGRKATILDPFCGSGTTLVECAHRGIDALGVDINPFSVFLANAKLAALRARTSDLEASFSKLRNAKRRKQSIGRSALNHAYLASWFDSDILQEIEGLRHCIMTELPKTHRPIFSSLISDVLREYSQQEPTDLRIRRRFSPMPAESIRDAIIRKIRKCLDSRDRTRQVIGPIKGTQVARSGTAEAVQRFGKQLFDGVVTSPPYATALPYIDTQRLSLVWLQLIPPSAIEETEESLIGAREAEKKTLRHLGEQLQQHNNGLPLSVNQAIQAISSKHTDKDGFRKKAVPPLLFRYFTRMKASLLAMRRSVRRGGQAVLVVGTNRTTAGDTTFEVNTPALLGDVAATVGWRVRELVPLQAYHRYGLHAKNAVQGESLLVLE